MTENQNQQTGGQLEAEQQPEQKQRKPRKEYTPEERETILANGETRGRKGLKNQRVNMVIYQENHDYIRTMSRARGETMTDFVNHIIEHYRTEHLEQYETALELLKSF